MTAEDILPLIAVLSPAERARLLRLITARPGLDAAAVYRAVPEGPEEFSSDEDSLAWESDGWEDFD